MLTRNCDVCKKVLINDRGVIDNHPNKVIKGEKRLWLCDECLAKEGEEKAEEVKAPEEKEDKVETKTAEPEKKTKKKDGKKEDKKK